MQHIVFVGLGGFLGAILRYKLGGLILHHAVDWRFPLGTFLVNVLGCVVTGVVAGLIERQDWFSQDARIFLLTGLLGGFTTFSAFGVETIYLMRRGAYSIAVLYVVLSVACGLAGLWLAMAAVPHRPLH